MELFRSPYKTDQNGLATLAIPSNPEWTSSWQEAIARSSADIDNDTEVGAVSVN